MNQQNHWDVLGLVPGATQPEIKTAYRRLMREFHVDTAADPDHARAAAINFAFEVLSRGDDATRPLIDEQPPSDHRSNSSTPAGPAHDVPGRPPQRARAGGTVFAVRWRGPLRASMWATGLVAILCAVTAVVSAFVFSGTDVLLIACVAGLLIAGLPLMFIRGSALGGHVFIGLVIALCFVAIVLPNLFDARALWFPVSTAIAGVALIVWRVSRDVLAAQTRVAQEANAWKLLIDDTLVNPDATIFWVVRANSHGRRCDVLLQHIAEAEPTTVLTIWGTPQVGTWIGLTSDLMIIGAAPKRAPWSFDRASRRMQR